MPNLITRFHLLLFWVTLATTAVAFLRVPAEHLFSMRWSVAGPSWLLLREQLLLIAPAVELVLLAAFFLLARYLPKPALQQTQHVLDQALTLLLTAPAACQLGFLLSGLGSDIDFIRLTTAALGLVLLVLGIVLFEADRTTYGGLRLPWLISAKNWRLSHRVAGVCYCGGGLVLLSVAWLTGETLQLITAAGAAILLPLLPSALVTLLRR